MQYQRTHDNFCAPYFRGWHGPTIFSPNFFAASGQFLQFLHEHRTPALVLELGAFILYGAIAVAFASSLVAFIAALRLIPWYAGVISGGLAILAAPLVLQQFTDRFVDGRASLVRFSGIGTLLVFF